MRVYATTVCARKCACGGIGYGKRLQESEFPKYVSVCRFGYADGFLRKRKNGVDGFKENANNLCMDVCIRENNKKRGEVVPILTDAAKTAELTGTIAYEVLCAATRRAEFVYEYE